jgi:hypothetical protein
MAEIIQLRVLPEIIKTVCYCAASRGCYNPVMTANNPALTIGRHGDLQFPYWYNGIIDEIRIYSKELCEAEVKALNKLKD